MASRLSIPDDFTLPDQNGQPVTLNKTLEDSKGTVLLPYRGRW